MNEQNLQPYSAESVSKARENGRIGGIKSGESKRLKKSWREIAETLGNSKVPDELTKKATKLFSKDELNGDMTHDALVIATAFRESESGNVQAMRFLADLKGEITQKLQVQSEQPLFVLTNDNEQG